MMGFMMVIWVILKIGYECLGDSFNWGESGILGLGLFLRLGLFLLPVILIWAVVWDCVDKLFDWTPRFPVLEAVFGRSHQWPNWVNNILSQDEIDGMSHQWSAFWIVVLARVFFGLNGWFRWMVILSVPWAKLNLEFDWNTPQWLFMIVTGIITIVWNHLKSKVDDWKSRNAIRRDLRRNEELGRTKEKSEEED